MGTPQSKTIKKKLKEVTEISPFSEMNIINENTNKMTDLIKSTNDIDIKNFRNKKLDTEQNELPEGNIANDEATNQGVKQQQSFNKIIQNVFLQEEKEELEFRFLMYSSNGIMSFKKFWKLLGLEQIADTDFGKLFYQTACNFNDNKDPNKLQFMTKEKYFQFVAIFTKTKLINEERKFDNCINSTYARDVRLNFLYSLFDVDNNEEVNKIEFRNFISSFLEMIFTLKFECAPIQEEINNILNKNSSNGTNNTAQIMERVIDSYVDDAFMKSFTGETLSFDEWKAWVFDEIAGIEEILDFSAMIVSSNNKEK